MDLSTMIATWDGGNVEVRQRAWAKVSAKLRQDPRKKVMERSREQLGTWIDEVGGGWIRPLAGGVLTPGGVNERITRTNALPAFLDAIAAMLVDEVLSDDERDELLAPLRSVTEPVT
jgi:hypothetical protein